MRKSWTLGLVAVIVLAAFVAAIRFNSTPSTPPRPVIRIQLDFIPGAEHAFLYAAKKIFAEEGYELEILPGTTDGSSWSANMVDSKAAEFGLCSGETALLARASAQPRNIIALAVFYPNTPAEIYSLKGKGIQKPEDLYGKRLGVLKGSSAYRNYEAFARKIGLDRSRITEVPTTGDVKEFVAVGSGLDAMVQFGFQHPILLKLQGRELNEIPFRNYGVKVYGQSLITYRDLAEERPELVQKVVEAIQRAYLNALEHPEEVLAQFLKEHPEVDARFSREKFYWVNRFVSEGVPPGKPIGYNDEAGWRGTYDYLSQQGLIQREIQLSDVFNPSFLNPKLRPPP